MISKHVCPKCRYVGEVYIPEKPVTTILSCPICKETEDIQDIINFRNLKTRKEIERENSNNQYNHVKTEKV